MGKLNAVKVRSLKEPGRYGDGDGLMLVIGKDGRRAGCYVASMRASGGSWALARLITSPWPMRVAAHEMRKQVREGLDPVAEKRKMAQTTPTFREAARRVHAEHRPAWKNAKHGAQWLSTLERYAFPALGDVPVDQITAPMIRDVLAVIWLTIPETARRVRQRIGTVLDWAHAKGYRLQEAPMRSVSKGLPRQPNGQEHFAAMPWQDVPDFILTLRTSDKAGRVVKLLFEFLILTAARLGEARSARWAEINMKGKRWILPKERMKAGRVHVVPLSEPALAVLDEAAKLRTSDAANALVFPGAKPERPMSDMALTMLLRRLEARCTTHGFRSSFRDWSAEATNFPREVAEAAIAHAVENRVEAAYRRSDFLEKRRDLMAAWGAFCTGPAGNGALMG